MPFGLIDWLPDISIWLRMKGIMALRICTAYQHVVMVEGSFDEVISPRETSRYPLTTNDGTDGYLETLLPL